MQHIDMETFANGALSEQFNRELETVTRNICDPNTDAKKPRKITLTITFKPNDQRDFNTAAVEARSTLAPTLGVVTAFNMGKDIRTGDVYAVEIGNQLPGQLTMAIPEPSQAAEPETIQTVDPSTGEIYETPIHTNNNVIDLRQARQA